MKNKVILLGVLISLLKIDVLMGQNLFLQENALIYVQEDANLSVGGDLQNDGAINNFGTVSVFGSFINNNMFTSMMGELAFIGDDTQQVVSSELDLQRLTIDGGSNEVMIEADTIFVSDQLEFINGILKIRDNAQLIIQESAVVTGGNGNSYFDGALIQIGTGFKYYPIGNNGVFAPIAFDDITGSNVKMKVSVVAPGSSNPPISEDIIGVSGHALWKVEVEDGDVDSALVSIDFDQADLENFGTMNEINADTISPVIVKKNAIEDTFVSLGVSELLADPPFSSGSIVAEAYLKPKVEEERFVAIGLAPLVPETGFIYVPDAFSPNAIDEDNKSFKVFGVKVLEEDFELRIFDRANVLLYETSSYTEANENGWNGTNQNNGNDSPNGLYYYVLRYRLEGDTNVIEERNAIYLIR